MAPSGGRMDEIIRAVRDCPSGALSYAIDGVEARDEVDRHGTREPAIEVTKDGPYRVTGEHRAHRRRRRAGAAQPRAPRASTTRCAAAATRRTSRSAAGCTGTSTSRTRCPIPTRSPTIFEWAGGLPALTRMTRLFYEKYVPAGPAARAAVREHVGRPSRARRQVAGRGVRRPAAATASEYGGYPRMLSQHIGKGLTEEKRAPVGAADPAAPPRRPGCPPTRSSARRSAPTSSGARGSRSRTPSPAPNRPSTCRCRTGTGTPPPGRPAAGSRRSQPRRRAGPAGRAARGRRAGQLREAHQTLFRQRDRQSMRFAFDLWSYDDVQAATPTRSSSASATARCRATAPGRTRRQPRSTAGSRPGCDRSDPAHPYGVIPRRMPLRRHCLPSSGDLGCDAAPPCVRKGELGTTSQRKRHRREGGRSSQGHVSIRIRPLTLMMIRTSSPKSGSRFADEQYCHLTMTGRVTGEPHRIQIWFAIDHDTL